MTDGQCILRFVGASGHSPWRHLIFGYLQGELLCGCMEEIIESRTKLRWGGGGWNGLGDSEFPIRTTAASSIPSIKLRPPAAYPPSSGEPREPPRKSCNPPWHVACHVYSTQQVPTAMFLTSARD